MRHREVLAAKVASVVAAHGVVHQDGLRVHQRHRNHLRGPRHGVAHPVLQKVVDEDGGEEGSQQQAPEDIAEFRPADEAAQHLQGENAIDSELAYAVVYEAEAAPAGMVGHGAGDTRSHPFLFRR